MSYASRLPPVAKAGENATPNRFGGWPDDIIAHMIGSPSAASLVFTIVAFWLLSACGSSNTEHRLIEISGNTMGTSYSIKLRELPGDLPAAALRREIDSILDRINRRMSTYIEHSELSLFNRSRQTAWFDISPELAGVLREARHVSAVTGGAFDVTVGPLVDLWGFGPAAADDQIPSRQQISETRQRVGYERLELRDSPPALKKHRPDIHVDLSAIAKGHAVDKLAGYLDTLGIEDYLVEIGGEIKARGGNAKGNVWRIAIEKPSTAGRAVHMVIELKDAGLATSGDYRNYFELEGRRYPHAIDPASGRPVSHRLASVTVIDGSVMRADAWATALLVVGPDAGFQLAEAQGIAALLVIRTENGFENRATTAFGKRSPTAINAMSN